MPQLPHRRGTTKEIPLFDIRLENDILTFRGPSHEATGAVIQGHIAVSVNDQTTVRGITLLLQGFRRLNILGSRTEEIFYEKEWTMLDGGRNGVTMAVKNYTFPFSEPLDGSLPESLEGLEGGTHVVYRLKARISRGRFAHDITAKKHVRIIRTLPPEALEISQTMIVENLWPNKVQYSISTPAKAVVFGTWIPVNIVILPQLKGLRVGNVTCQLKQTVTLKNGQRAGVQKSDTQIIDTQIFEPTAIEDAEEDLGRFEIHECFMLPKSLSRCVQYCEMDHIKVRHKLHFTVALHNPDSHVSELRASLPLHLFIAPHASSSNPLNMLSSVSAPPAYDDHYLDRLYGSLDPYDSPSTSGTTTPNVLSRTTSPEPPSSGDTSTEDLGRVPSYNTACRAGVRGLDGEVAPAYDVAGRPPLPRSESTPDRHITAHLFSGRNRNRSSGASATSGER